MKYVAASLLILTLFIGGCSDNHTAQETNSEVKASSDSTESTVSTETKSTKTTITDSPQAPDDSSLTEVGESFQDADGSITLNAISDYDETTTIGDVELHISDVKIMNYAPSPDLIDFFHGYSDNETQFNYVKLRVTVKNTSDKAVNFAPISMLETGSEKKGFEDDFYLESLYGVYAPNEERSGQLGFVLNETKVENLKAITVHTSDVFDQNKESLTKSKTIEVPF
ncbi:hypothetical protein ABFG93_06110 [Pseudalkalibacillus hwajinpoensis]|uniref:DUF4352 domain-containing protein n=1 Tax=Guptibacillus hwajinpoensis TaxID=208199 RepID=UPI00325B4196